MSKFGTIHHDRALTDVSVGYENAELIGERIYPVVPVENQSDKYFKHGKDIFTVRDDRRSPGGEARESRWTLSDDNFFCEGHALKDYVPRENQGNSDPQLDLLTDTTEVLTDQIMLNQEVNLVTILAAAMTGTSLAAQTLTPWNDDDVDPLPIIETQKIAIAKRIGKPPNVLVMSGPVWSAMKLNANIRMLITGAGSLPGAVITPQNLAAYLDLKEVLVGSAVKNTANEGQDVSLDFVWGEYALLFYRPQSPGRKTLSLGYTFAWKNALGASAGGQFVDRYYWQPNKADVVEVHKYYDQKTIDAGAGCLFSNCLST